MPPSLGNVPESPRGSPRPEPLRMRRFPRHAATSKHDIFQSTLPPIKIKLADTLRTQPSSRLFVRTWLPWLCLLKIDSQITRFLKSTIIFLINDASTRYQTFALVHFRFFLREADRKTVANAAQLTHILAAKKPFGA